MFERHFGLRENPFVAGHQHRFVYPSPEHLEALAHLRYGIENREPFVLITGEVGTGKTTALYDALSEWESRVVVALITNSALTRAELLEEIALRFGVIVHPGSSKPQIMTALERHLLAVRARQHRAILLLDEAQNLERELLEEIRLLSNLENAGDNLLQVVLVGQPELEEKLARPELRQLRQRITVHYRLSSLSPEDTERYIQHRVSVAGGHALSVFPTDSCRAIHRLTTGIPREINHLAAQAMLTAYVDDAPNVRVEHVEVAAREIQFKSVSRPGVAGEPPLPRSFAPPLAAEPWPVAMAPPPQVPAEPPAPMPTPLPVPARPEPRSVAPEGPHRTASSAAWDAWMSAIANPADAARQHEAHATAPPSPAPPAYTPPVIHPSIPLEPRARESESDFATRLDAAALAPAAAPAPPAVTHESELPAAEYLPARLREKLERDTAEAEPPRNPVMPWLIAVGAVAVIGISVVLWMRFRDGRAATASTPTPAPAARAAATVPMAADSVLRAARDSSSAARDSVAAAPTAGTPLASVPEAATTGAASLPMLGSRAPAVATSPFATRAPATTPMRYGVVVRTLIVRERADAERDRLEAATGLPARVMVVKEPEGESYRVVVGEWSDRVSAERGASDLIRQGQVDEARVVSIGRAPARP